MKVFQILHRYDPYIPYFENKYDVEDLSYEEHRKLLIQDRFYGLHLLEPCLDVNSNSFYTMWNYEKLQLKWAREKGWNETDLKEIIYAQIEDKKPDVFYSGSPTLFSNEEVSNRIPSSIIKLTWCASPIFEVEKFEAYRSRLTNVPFHLEDNKKGVFRTDMFQPAYDPVMAEFETNEERPIDVFFYGQYASQYFKQRNELIDQLLNFKQKSNLNIEIALQYKLEKVPVNIPFFWRYFKKTEPNKLVRNSAKPLYGLDLYKKISQSKIVFNAGVDFSKEYKVNMRNFEVLGCGTHLLSDVGIYPDHFESNKHFSTYTKFDECAEQIDFLIRNPKQRIEMAMAGNKMIKEKYSKNNQWKAFQKIVAEVS